MYFLNHPHTFYHQPPSPPLQLKPILLFYPIPHLLNPSLLTLHPHYPSQTSLLPHPLTSTKTNNQDHHQSLLTSNPNTSNTSTTTSTKTPPPTPSPNSSSPLFLTQITRHTKTTHSPSPSPTPTPYFTPHTHPSKTPPHF
nr:YaaC family protein [Bacillus altitudinis]